MAKLGKIKLSITDESLSTSVQATSYPVEKGVPFSDHVSRNPQSFSINGYILGSNYQTNLSKLRTSMNKGEILTYTGRKVAKDVIILSIDDTESSEVANGSAISIKLQSVRIVKTSWRKSFKKPTNAGKKPKNSKKPSKAAVYHKVKKGDTYWSLSKKYKTSMKQLKTWNKYPDRSIPIGVKLRVK